MSFRADIGGGSVSFPGAEINADLSRPSAKNDPDVPSPRAEINAGSNRNRATWDMPTPRMELDSGLDREDLEVKPNARHNRPELNTTYKRPSDDYNFDSTLSRPELDYQTDNQSPRRHQIDIPTGRSPRAEFNASVKNPPQQREADLKLRRPSIDTNDFHNLSDGELPSTNTRKPHLKRWTSAEEINRSKSKKHFNYGKVPYERIYTKDGDLSTCNYKLTPQNNLLAKAAAEGRGRLGSGYQKRPMRYKYPNLNRIKPTNWTQKVRQYRGTAYQPRLHHYRDVYNYDTCDPPYSLNYLNSDGFSHAIPNPRFTGQSPPNRTFNLRPNQPMTHIETRSITPDQPVANIDTRNVRIKRRPRRKTACCCADDDVDTVDNYHRHTPEIRVRTPPVPPKATIHTPRPPQPKPIVNVTAPPKPVVIEAAPPKPVVIEAAPPKPVVTEAAPPKPVVTVDPLPKPVIAVSKPVKPTVSVHTQTPHVSANVRTPSPVGASPRVRHQGACCTCCSDSDVDVIDTPKQVRQRTPSPDISLKPEKVSPRVTQPYHVQATAPKVEPPEVKINTPRYTIKPISKPNFKLNVPRPTFSKPTIRLPRPRANFRIKTPPKLNVRPLKLKPIKFPTFRRSEKADIKLDTPKPTVKPSNVDVRVNKPYVNVRGRGPIISNVQKPVTLKPLKTNVTLRRPDNPLIRVTRPKINKPKAAINPPRPVPRSTFADLHINDPRPGQVDVSRPQIRTPNVSLEDLQTPGAAIRADVPTPPDVYIDTPEFGYPGGGIQADVPSPKPIIRPQSVDVKANEPYINVDVPNIHLDKPFEPINADLSAPRLEETPRINVDGPKLRSPRMETKPTANLTRPMVRPTFADLQINAPRPGHLMAQPPRVTTPEVGYNDPESPRAYFRAEVPTPPDVEPDIDVPESQFRGADVPKPVIRPINVDVRPPELTPPRAEIRADIDGPQIKPPEVKFNSTPPKRPEADVRPPRVSLPPVSSNYNPPPAPNTRAPKQEPNSITLPRLPQPPRPYVEAAPKESAPRDRVPRQERNPPASPHPTNPQKSDPPQVEPIKWRLRPSEDGRLKKRQPSPSGLSEPDESLTYYPPSRVAIINKFSPNLRARLY